MVAGVEQTLKKTIMYWIAIPVILLYIYIYIYTEMCQKYSVTVIFYYIFHVKPHFWKTLFQSRLLFDFVDFFTNKNEFTI